MLTIGYAGALERCRSWLKAELADGPKLRVPLFRTAQAQGYNPSNIDIAAKQLGIVSDRVRVEGVGWRARWTLPPESDERRPVNPAPNPARQIPVADDVTPTQLTEQL
jgi:hypothetical protein